MEQNVLTVFASVYNYVQATTVSVPLLKEFNPKGL